MLYLFLANLNEVESWGLHGFSTSIIIYAFVPIFTNILMKFGITRVQFYVTSGGLFSSTLRGVVKSSETCQFTFADLVGGGGGAPGTRSSFGVQILSFSWSFY